MTASEMVLLTILEGKPEKSSRSAVDIMIEGWHMVCGFLACFSGGRGTYHRAGPRKSALVQCVICTGNSHQKSAASYLLKFIDNMQDQDNIPMLQ